MAELIPETKPSGLFENLFKFGTAAIQFRQQHKLQSVQLERARAGKPLLPVESLMIPVSAQVGLSQGTNQMMKMGMYIAGGLAAAYLLSQVMKR